MSKGMEELCKTLGSHSLHSQHHPVVALYLSLVTSTRSQANTTVQLLNRRAHL
jgi:hypothetical protein